MNDAAVFVSAKGEGEGGEAGPDTSDVTQHPLLGLACVRCACLPACPLASSISRSLARRQDRMGKEETGKGETSVIDTEPILF